MVGESSCSAHRYLSATPDGCYSTPRMLLLGTHAVCLFAELSKHCTYLTEPHTDRGVTFGHMLSGSVGLYV